MMIVIPSNFISIVSGAWPTVIIFAYIVANTENTIFLVKASDKPIISLWLAPNLDDSQHREEYSCLLQTGWWSGNASSCDLFGMTCNHAGSITSDQHDDGRVLAKVNLTCFLSLVSLNLTEAGLMERIPPEIGSLSKLTNLDLFKDYQIG